MDNTYQLFHCDLKIPCDTFQCHGRAEYFIGRPQAPKNTLTKVCGQCAKELIDSAVGIAYAAKETAEVIEAPETAILLPFEPESPVEEEIEITVNGQPITEMTVKELKAVCKDLGLKGYSDKKEAELIAMIEEATNDLGIKAHEDGEIQ